MYGVCEDCFKKEEVAEHGDIEFVKLSTNDQQCTRCGKNCKCVEDYEFKGSNPGMKWLMKNSTGWKKFG